MSEDNWRPEDAAAVREFLTSAIGQKFLAQLSAGVIHKDSGDIAEEALNYRELKGQMSILRRINLLTSDQEPTPGNVTFFPTN